MRISEKRVERLEQYADEETGMVTGVPVRALDLEGRWSSQDIVLLDAESLDEFLREKPTEFSRNLVMILLGHRGRAFWETEDV